jgi:spoIIIJ-associated protein
MNIVKSALNLFGISKDEEVQGVVNLDEFLAGLPRAMGYDIQLDRHQKDDGSHHIEIKGAEVMSMLGENTQILDALAHISMRVLRKQEGLANKAIEEGTDLSKYRVTVDAEGFRDRHQEGLKKIAEEAREKVISNNGRPTYIPALSPSERRIIHTHLATLGEVTSESIGNGTYKRIRVKLINDTSRPIDRGNGNPRAGGNRPQGAGFRKGRGPRNFNNRGPNRNARRSDNDNVRRSQFDDHQNSGGEVNGNVAPPEETIDDIDDNIGNR